MLHLLSAERRLELGVGGDRVGGAHLPPASFGQRLHGELHTARDRPAKVRGPLDPPAPVGGQLVVQLDHDRSAGERRPAYERCPTRLVGGRGGDEEARAAGVGDRALAPPGGIGADDEHERIAVRIGRVAVYGAQTGGKAVVGERTSGHGPRDGRVEHDLRPRPRPAARERREAAAGQSALAGDGREGAAVGAERRGEQAERRAVGAVSVQRSDHARTVGVAVDRHEQGEHLGLLRIESGVGADAGERAAPVLLDGAPRDADRVIRRHAVVRDERRQRGDQAGELDRSDEWGPPCRRPPQERVGQRFPGLHDHRAVRARGSSQRRPAP